MVTKIIFMTKLLILLLCPSVTLLNQFSKKTSPLICDHPQYLIRILIVCHPLGKVWSPWPDFNIILLGPFRQSPPYFLVIFHPLTPPCSLAINFHFPMLYWALNPSSLPYCKIPLRWSLVSTMMVLNKGFLIML